MTTTRPRPCPLSAFALCAVAIAAPTFAQDCPPDVATLNGELTLRTHIDSRLVAGCSRGRQTVEHAAEVVLAIDRHGAASLTVHSTMHSVLSTIDTFRIDDDVQRARFIGQAVRTADGLDIHFVRTERAHASAMPLPAPTIAAENRALHCRIAQTRLLPADGSSGEPARAAPLLECAWEPGVVFPFYDFHAGALTLGAGAGVRVVASEGRDHVPQREVRAVR